MNNAVTYEDRLLEGWEDVHKKAQLSLLILLALKESPKHVAQIKQFILDATHGLQTTDEQSLYRSLRRFTSAEMVEYEETQSKSGPNKKLYKLTEIGESVLQKFAKRNVIDVLYSSKIRQLVERSAK